MDLPESAQGTQEEALPTVESAHIKIKLSAFYGEDHVLVPEYEA